MDDADDPIPGCCGNRIAECVGDIGRSRSFALSLLVSLAPSLRDVFNLC